MSFSNPAAHLFPLPEVFGYAQEGTGGIGVFISAAGFAAPLPVSGITYTFHKNNGSFTFHVWFKNGDILDIPLGVTRASEFEDWLKHHGMKISEDKAVFATGGFISQNVMPNKSHDDEFVTLNYKSTPKATTPTTCPVCYGTGFFKGFGGPCSSGCRPGR